MLIFSHIRPANNLTNNKPADVVMTVQKSHIPSRGASSKKAIITVAKDIVVATVLEENSAEFSTHARSLRPIGSMSAIFMVVHPKKNPTDIYMANATNNAIITMLIINQPCSVEFSAQH